MKLETSDLDNISRGAAFLGTGGGGDPYIGKMLAISSMQDYGTPEIIDPMSLADDATVLTIAMLGAPTVLTEKAATGEDVDLAIAKMESYLGRKADAIMPIEIGGVNSMLPIVAASRSGLPLVDADGMGRAFPELQMVTFGVYGVSCTPMAVIDDHLNSLIVETGTAKRAEDIVRVCSIEMGCSVIVSCYPLNGKQVKEFGVHGTLTLALEIGRAIKHGEADADPIDRLMGYLKTTPYYQHCKVIFDGKVTDILRETTQGFAIGHCHIDAIDGSEEKMEIVFQNEYLVAKVGDELRAIVPDLICIVDRETTEPIPVESLKYGQRVRVLGVSSAPIMRTPQALSVFGPRNFGLDFDFVPIEQL